MQFFKKIIGMCGLLTLATPLAATAQVTVFNDTFANGSTFNGVSKPGGTPAASSTSYDFDSSKTGVESISSGNLKFSLSSATTSGFIEAQALFTATPVALATVGDYIDLTYTFTDTGNLLAGGTSAAIYTGLYNSGGGNAPVAGTKGVSGNAVTLNTNSPSVPASLATGNAALWQGYVGTLVTNGANCRVYSRPVQNGSGTPSQPNTGLTDSANQDLIGNNFGSGAFNNPASSATFTDGSLASTVTLTNGDQYTVDFRITLTTVGVPASAGTFTITDNLYSGADTLSANNLFSMTTYTASTLLATSFDGLAIGIRNSGASLNPEMALNKITISASIASTSPPVITSIVPASGGQITINATNGVPSGPVNVLASTNMALPLTSWTTNTVTAFDGNGNLSLTFLPAATPSFYLLQEP